MNSYFFDSYRKKKVGVKKVERTESLDQWGEYLMQPGDPVLPDARKTIGGSFILLYAIVAVAAVILSVRLGYLQFVMGDNLGDRAQNNYVRHYVTRALRGVLFDRNHTLLVQNIPRNDAAVIPADLPRDSTERRRLFQDLSTLLGMTALEIETQVKANEFYYLPIVLRENIDHETKLTLLAQYPNNAQGVLVVEDFYREYTSGPEFSHVLGYLGKVQAEELAENPGEYTNSSEIGRTGVEYSYESDLRGRDGVRAVHINAQGKVVDILATSASVEGCDVVLTIDAALQQRTRAALAAVVESTGSESGAVVVMDPRTGAILSLVSYPDFDNSIFSNGLKGDEVSEFEELSQDPAKPFLNRAIGGVYPPGSTFKLVTATAGLAEGVVTAATRLDAPGSFSIPHQYFPDKFFVYKDWKSSGHGMVNVVEALAESADTYFYKVAGGFDGLTGLGIERLKKYSAAFGLGKKLGIDLPGEASGLVPDDAWKRENIGEGWYTGDSYNLGIGQGYLLLTPLQVAEFTSVIANGGTVYRPHVVDSTEGCEGARTIEPMVINANVASPEVINTVRSGMRLAVTGVNGTAKSFQSFSVPIAGKTGTAQFNNNEDEHAWFTAYAPYDNPEIVVTALVEGGGEGSEVAIPVVRRVLEAYFTR